MVQILLVSRVMLLRVVAYLVCVLGMLVVPAKVEAVGRVSMRVVSAESAIGKELVTLEFSATSTYQRAFLLHYPERVVVDLDTVTASGIGVPANYKGKLIKGMRFAQYNPTTSRLVIEVNQPLRGVSVHSFNGSGANAPMKMVVELALGDEALQQQQFSKRESRATAVPSNDVRKVAVMSPKTAAFEHVDGDADVQTEKKRLENNRNKPFLSWYKPSPSVVDQQPIESVDIAVKEESLKQEKVKQEVKEDTPRSSSKKKQANDEVASRTSELNEPPEVRSREKVDGHTSHAKGGKPIIMIDAGHGGKDPGASTGKDGDYEKHITLKYAKSLAKALNDTGKYRAKLTRDDDSFIMLGERVNIARIAGASMFISIHADSAPASRVEGLSIYTLSETSSDKETAALAEQENNSDKISGMDLSGQKEEVADILIDLARRETKNKSMDLAEQVVHGVRGQGVKTLRDPHRFAGFKVLKAPDIPSVLIELGFLSTPSEVANLKSSAHRGRIIRGIVAGVNAYFGK